MKTKLGKLDAIKGTKYDSYQSLFKKKILEVLKDPKANGICEYVLVDGEYLDWKGSSPNGKQPLLYLGQKTTWEKDVKANKDMDLTAYSYGTCKLVKVGSDVEIALCPEKGKLTQDTLLKPLKKVFKSFKPKTYLEVVTDLDIVENSVVVNQEGDGVDSSEDVDLAEEDESSINLLQTIGQDLQKYHLVIGKIKKAIAATKTEEDKMTLLVKQNKVLKRLKHLCASWAEDIAPQADELITEKQGETWQQIYNKWSLFFEKRKAVKEGKSLDQDAIKAQEENIYIKAVKDLEQFYDNLEKGNLIDPSIVETNIENLERHLDKWKVFVKDKTVSFPNELRVLETKLTEIKEDWKLIDVLTISYWEKSEKYNQALTSGNDDLAIQLYEELESINNQIVNL